VAGERMRCPATKRLTYFRLRFIAILLVVFGLDAEQALSEFIELKRQHSREARDGCSSKDGRIGNLCRETAQKVRNRREDTVTGSRRPFERLEDVRDIIFASLNES
jgi:hypothetical protein